MLLVWEQVNPIQFNIGTKHYTVDFRLSYSLIGLVHLLDMKVRVKSACVVEYLIIAHEAKHPNL